MGFRGFERQPSTVKIEAWPVLERESDTSYVIYSGRKLTVHVTDSVDYDTLYSSGEFTVDEGAPVALAFLEPDHVLYPSRQDTKKRTVKRHLANGHVNELHLYPLPAKDFYFMTGELHTLLHGPGTSLTATEDEPVGPYGFEEDYQDLRVFAFINNLDHSSPKNQ